MKLTLIRKPSSASCTQGELLIDGVHECYTLEDVVRPVKVAGITAIPAGTYRVTVTMSPRFGRLLPLLNDVPGFSGVRVHPGNTAADTEGCILVGDAPAPDFLGKSRAAFDRLLAKINSAAVAGERIEIEVK